MIVEEESTEYIVIKYALHQSSSEKVHFLSKNDFFYMCSVNHFKKC